MSLKGARWPRSIVNCEVMCLNCDVDQQSTEFNPDKKLSDLIRKILPVFIAFGRKDLSILGTSQEHPKLRVRDGLIYRLQAVLYNIHDLAAHQAEALKYMKDHFPHSMKQGEDWWINRARIQFYLFDNLIFNAVSAFDYLGCALGLLYLNKPKFKWNSLVKCARDHGNRFSSTEQARLILQWHAEWVDELFGYRSEVIHFSPDSAKSGTSLQSKGDQTMLSFYVEAPERLRKILPLLIDDQNPYLGQTAMQIVARLFLCCEQSFDCVNSEVLPYWKNVEKDLIHEYKMKHPIVNGKSE